ncbi:hypothetical protein JKP75_02740 [Blastococcus sp. TML/M2B]|uniref:hypothetical protein n=1 Tax=unclassified Blastococcus TaxID=2619396 RepID=UPI00190B3975|nr:MULTISPECIES: hypothetical protein [unclassified Blastococcus]MBN1091586.1 hypothetical protein [Blastococcus sp. TML/M2B]MBN1094862.1 hypothetical protein [Blastococcus sp. TML/C7B]
MSTAVQTVLAADQLPEDVGKAGPLGLLLIVVLLIATALLVKSMSGHLKKLPRSFDPEDEVLVPDDLSGLDARDEPGQELLDTLRRAPLAIEPPRDGDTRPENPSAQG